MRKTAYWMLLLAGFATAASTLAAQCGPNCPERRTISVTGSAQVTADADFAIVHVGYKLFAPDAKSAYAAALDTSNAVMQALTGAGIPKTAIESTGQVLQHTQPYELQRFPGKNDEWERRQFTVTQSWTIRVKPDAAGSALNTAITAGANESGWIQWIVNDPEALEARASAEAVANAHAIAEQIAQKSAVHLGHLVSVSENQAGRGYMMADQLGASYGMGSSFMVNGVLQPGGQQLAINSRRIQVTIAVNVTYSIE